MESPTAGVNGESSIRQAVPAKGHPNANLGRILQNLLLTAPARLFWVDQEPNMSAVNARFGSVSKGTAGSDITTRLKSVAR
jgi:hypothetical protein